MFGVYAKLPSCNHIGERRGKKPEIDTLKMLLSNVFWSSEFVFIDTTCPNVISW